MFCAEQDEAKSSELRLLHYSGWSGELPDDVTDLVQLLSVLTDYDARDTSLPPVVLQCRYCRLLLRHAPLPPPFVFVSLCLSVSVCLLPPPSLSLFKS